MKMKTMIKLFLGIGLLSFVAFLIYLPADLGVALAIPPDSSEYSISLANLFEHGRFGFTLNGEWHPSRYLPFFSLLCLAPAYLLSGGNVLCTHCAILVFALVLLTAIWKMGLLCGLGKLSVIPLILLMLVPDFLFYCRVAMTEIPYTAFFAVLALVFTRFANNQTPPSVKMSIGVGLLVASAGVIRATGFTLIIPFVVVALLLRIGWRRKLVLLASMIIPSAVMLLAGFVYNWIVFGIPFRNGYNYWQALPCDYPELMFNIKYVVPVALGYLKFPIIQFSLICVFVSLLVTFYVVRKKGAGKVVSFLHFEGYFVTHAVVLLLLHICYYTIDTRFFLPLTICFIPLFFIAVNILLSDYAAKLKFFSFALVVCFCGAFVLSSSIRYFNNVAIRSALIAETQTLASVLPAESIVLQLGDPCVADFFGFKDKGLRFFPMKRNIVYVSNMISTNRISHICQFPAFDVPDPHKTLSLSIVPQCIEAGISWLPFPSTFEECPEKLKSYVTNGTRVFVSDGAFCRREDFAALKLEVERMGLVLKKRGVCRIPRIPYNAVRHCYESFVFNGRTLDGREESFVTYYEIVPESISMSL